MNNSDYRFKIKAIEHYLEHGDSLRKTAARFGLYYPTLFKWVKKYRAFGPSGLADPYHRPWNRKPEIEETLLELIEHDPGISLRRAQQRLAEKGIKISTNGIWTVWKRYGYCGFAGTKLSGDFTEHISWTKEAEKKIRTAENIFNAGRSREAGAILNSIPAIPKNKLLTRIPDEFLNLRRRTEKICLLFGAISPVLYLNTLEQLIKECKAHNFFFTVLRLAFLRILILLWLCRVEEARRRIKEMDRQIKHSKSKTFNRRFFVIRYGLLISEGILCGQTLKIKKAFSIASRCAGMLRYRRLMPSYLISDLGTLYLGLDDYNRFKRYVRQIIGRVDEESRYYINFQIALNVHLLNNEQAKVAHFLEASKPYVWAARSGPLRIKSMLALLRGMPFDAITNAREALQHARQADVELEIINVYLTIATACRSLGENKEASQTLRRVLPLLKKNKMKKTAIIFRMLMGHRVRSSEALKLSIIKLLWLMRNRDYKESYRYARQKGIIFYFYRYLFFFPEIVLPRIDSGEPTYLPKAILKLPVFNQHAVVYRINFLGELSVYRCLQAVKIAMSPKDIGLLIHLSIRMPEPTKTVNLSELYQNFWTDSPNPARIFSHGLVRIKKALKLPGHRLEITRARGIPLLVNRNIYFNSDYQEFEQTLGQAAALEKAGEWDFARKEYRHAFRLFRAAPLSKIYDPWTLELRSVILNKLETAALHFAGACVEHNNRSDAAKILEKILQIVPGSEEIKNYLAICTR